VLKDSSFVLVDVQEKLWRVMVEREALLQHLTTLLRGLQLLDVPIVWMEQVPEKIGPTVPILRELLESDHQSIAKTSFSGFGDVKVRAAIEGLGRKHIVLAGMEAHVCVYQTASDLVRAGYRVSVVADAVTSRTLENKKIALEMIRNCGAQLTSVEAILFELLGSAEHPAFREIAKLIK